MTKQVIGLGSVVLGIALGAVAWVVYSQVQETPALAAVKQACGGLESLHSYRVLSHDLSYPDEPEYFNIIDLRVSGNKMRVHTKGNLGETIEVYDGEGWVYNWHRIKNSWVKRDARTTADSIENFPFNRAALCPDLSEGPYRFSERSYRTITAHGVDASLEIEGGGAIRKFEIYTALDDITRVKNLWVDEQGWLRQLENIETRIGDDTPFHELHIYSNLNSEPDIEVPDKWIWGFWPDTPITPPPLPTRTP